MTAQQLRPYQEIGADFLASRKAALLADEMRLGKCAQAVTACDRMNARAVTVICPASVCETWRREFRKWSNTAFSLEVWSYDMSAKGHARRWDNEIDVLILDEAHYLKNYKAKRTQEIFGKKCDGGDGLIEQAARVFLLTGTPMPNNPSELWPALRALAPESIENPKSNRPYNFWQFVNKFCKTRDNGFGIEILGAKNHDVLRAKLEPFMLRRTLAEVKPEIEPLTFDDLYVEGKLPADVPSAEIETVRAALEADGIDGLRKIAPHVATLRRYTGLAKAQPVIEWVKNWIEAGGSKICLYAHHREVIDYIFTHFSTQTGLRSARVWGLSEQASRQREIDYFQNRNAQIFIGQIQAAGEGIDLSAADELIFVESSWVPKDNLQVAWRIMNLEQDRPKLVRFATLAGSIDEQISRTVRRKTIDIAKIFGNHVAS